MYGVFKRYGWIDGVVIPGKRDKMGRRYGFARFLNVKDPRVFAIELDNIIIGRQKIYANLPRFVCEDMKRQEGANVSIGSGVANAKVRPPTTWRKRTQGHTYANIVRGEGATTAKGGGAPLIHRKQASRKANWNAKWKKVMANIEFHTREQLLGKMNRALVGEMINPGASYLLQEEFHRQELFDVKVTPLGANLALLEETEHGYLAEMMWQEGGWLVKWVREIRNWTPREVDNEIFAWLRCYGVPPHAWCDEFFKLIIAPIGEFIGTDTITRIM